MSEENNSFEDKAKEFAEGAKETAKEFADSAKEAFAGQDNKKILAGILAIFLGGFGIHKFILGYNKEGIILLVVTIIIGAITCGFAATVTWIITVIEGIIYLTKSDEEFYNTYQVGRKPWF
ncbi:NINE protein [Leptobacterium flavescens]|uniref:NINE protein n=1 Tax=Leptobacterium flavescens TaxID=472055 RepID=A0A6P0UI15_9FLAO|nr:NINE protein [Leptobacterium flavescens]NER12925.1 NINE protein [Leptobacterium flavescens]